MRVHRSLAQVVIALLVLSCPGVGAAGWSVYDDFKEQVIDPGKWFGTVATNGTARPSTDVNRVVQGGRLLLGMTQWGGDADNAGSVNGSNSLRVKDPAGILGMEAQVIVSRAEAEACVANTLITQSRSRMLSSFFNDGTSTGPGDATGDIVGNIETVLDAAAGRVIRAVMFRCLDSGCVTGGDVVVNEFVTKWKLQRAHTLRVVWNPANREFVYTVTPKGGAEETLRIPYSYSDSDPASGKFALLQARLTVPDCSGERAHATMEFSTNHVSILTAP